jgi:mannose-6-phosphate isomerase
MANERYYPFHLRALEKEMVWGGRKLERIVGKSLTPKLMIGETWEAWDGCVIENGAHQGQKLQDVIVQDPVGLIGSTDSRFPLLFKFIDAQNDLSVQVHPDDAQAQSMEHYPFGKTEAWYILDAEPDAKLILGFNRSVTREDILQALSDKTLVNLMTFVPVKRGDVIFVPAGTVHAICKGIVVAEIQENSDITYRFYDWERQIKGRELHIEQSLRVFSSEPVPQPHVPSLMLPHPTFDEHFLVACKYFLLTMFDVRGRVDELNTNGKFHIVSVIEGEAEIRYSKASSTIVKQGQTFLLPAHMGEYAIESNRAKMLRMFVPNLRADVIDRLKAVYPMSEIVKLGGSIQKHNDLIPLIR